jgi:wyosine [tRNA(Phe)-imidazoG37] synthetase (radical SAM superfamily)
MLYTDVEQKWKLSISGSMTNILKGISEDADFDTMFDYWYKDKFEEVEGQLQYVKIITDERFDVDEELLEDIKKVFEERFHKKIDKVKVNTVERVKKQKVEPATDKQLKYAKKLYKQVYGEAKGFNDKEYSKHEMVLIIGELVERLDKMQQGNYDECKIIELNNFRK